jgi:benzoyl-CoA reductase subunit C
MAIKGEYDFLDGLVMPECCDNITAAYNILTYNLEVPYSHYIMVPHMLRHPSFEFFDEELAGFKKSIEAFSGKEASDQDLIKAIGLHNENRVLARELYELRKQDPPLISGVEVIKTMVAAMSLPVKEANQLFRNVIGEIRERPVSARDKKPRILLYGAEIDDPMFIDIIEGSGAYVVMDDLCVGSRCYWHDVEMTGDPVNDLSTRYLGKLTCPRTFREKEGTRQEDLDNRFGYLLEFAKEFNVDGVIFYLFRNCDTFAFDAPDVRDYLRQAGLPVLHLEDEYNMSGIARLKIRVQAFVEMIT